MLLTLIAVVLVGWFAGGTVWNVRRGNAVLRWLQPALKRLGDRTTLRWLGSSAVELVIRDPKPPFKAVTVVVFLEPRDMPWLWALSRRRDTIIVRGELRAAPHGDLEALDLASWSGRDALRKAEALPVRADGVFASSRQEMEHARELRRLAARSGLPVRRLAVHGTAPHLVLHVDAPPHDEGSPGPLFDSLRELGERA